MGTDLSTPLTLTFWHLMSYRGLGVKSGLDSSMPEIKLFVIKLTLSLDLDCLVLESCNC